MMLGKITITMNAQREICAIQKSGAPFLTFDQILQFSRIAAVKAEEITQLIQNSQKLSGLALSMNKS